MKKSLISLSFIFLFMISFASATISLNDPLEVYNLGDEIPLIVTLAPNSNEGWFTVELVCGSNSEVLEKIIGKSFYTGEEQTRSLRIPLVKDYIGNSTGDCKIRAAINSEEAYTPKFDISNGINVEATLDKERYDPGETATLTLTAIKKNGRPLNGFVKVSGMTSITKAVVDGAVVEQFAIPETIESGRYDLTIFAYDELSGETLNSANTTKSLTVNQVPTFIQTSLADLEATPGEDFKISLEIVDQAGIKMEGLITLTILSPTNQETILKVKSGDSVDLNLPTNSTPGTWRLLPSYEGLLSEKEFTVLPLQKIEFELQDSLLIVKNVGNTLYNQTIDINIGENIETLNLNIAKGETRKFNLNAPTGEYEVNVRSGESSVQKNVLLTGNAISIEDSSGVNFFSRYPLIWIFLVIIIVVAGVIFFRKGGKAYKLKEKTHRKIFQKRTKKTKAPQTKEFAEPHTEKKHGGAESTLVLTGEKGRATVLALKISNMQELGTNAKKELLEILKIAKEAKGMIERKDNYLMIIFSPLTTKTFHNEILAAKTGDTLLRALNAYNTKFTEKIKFNMGINAGDLISSMEKGKLQYTSLGNTISLSRRMADLSEGKLLVSDHVRNKILRDIKVEKLTTINKTHIYSVSEVTDREANNEKLKDILKRMKN